MNKLFDLIFLSGFSTTTTTINAESFPEEQFETFTNIKASNRKPYNFLKIQLNLTPGEFKFLCDF